MASTEVGAIHYSLDMDMKAFDDSIKAVTNSLNKLVDKLEDTGGKGEKAIVPFSDKLKKVGADMGQLGTKLSTRVTAPIVGALGLATKSAIDYESAFAGVRKTVDASEAEFAQLSDNLRGIAKQSPISATELAGITEVAGQLGVRGVDSLTKFTDTAAKLGVTTNLSGEMAATMFARIANIMQEPLENVDRMGAVVVDLGNNFATTESEIAEFATRIAGAGKIAGLTTADIFAIGTAMSSVGIEAEAGGTAVQKVLLEMNNAVASGSDKLGTFAKVAGVSSEEFAKAFRGDASQAFQLFVDGIASRGEEASMVFDEIEMKDVRLMRAFLSLANAGDVLTNSFDTSAKAWEENTALAEEAGKRFGTTASQLKVFRNNMTDLGIVVGGTLLPAINDLVKAIVPLIQGFASFADKHPGVIKLATAVGLLLAVIGPGLLIAGGLITAIVSIKAVLIAVIPIIGLTVGAMLGWVAIVAVMIGAIVAFVVTIVKNWDKIKEVTSILFEKISGIFGKIKDTVTEKIASLVDTIKEKFNSFVDFLKEVGAFVWEVVKVLASPFVWWWENVTEPILLLAQAIILRGFYEVFEFIKGIVLSVMDFLTEKLFKPIVALFNSIKEAISKVWNDIKNNVINPIVSSIVSFVTSKWSAFSDWIKKIWDGIKKSIIDPIVEAKNKAVGAVTDVYNGITGKLSGLVDKLKSIGNNILNALIKPFDDAKKKIEETAEKIRKLADKINPFHKESPSLVENVQKGLGMIAKEYEKLGNMSIPSANSLLGFGGENDLFGGATVTRQNVYVNVDKMGDRMDLDRVGRELGFKASLVPGLT